MTETEFDEPEDDGHVTHFTVPALPWRDPSERVVGRVVPDDVVGAIRAAGQAALDNMLSRVTPENVHPEYHPAYECEDCETDECEED